MRLSIEISPEQHCQIKALAAFRGQTIKDLVLEKVFEDTTAWDELMLVLDKRIAHAENEGVSSRTVSQIAKEVLRRNSEL